MEINSNLHMDDKQDELTRRLTIADRELYAIRSSSTWALAQRLQRVSGGLRRLVRQRQPVRSISVCVKALGPDIQLSVKVKPGVGPTDLILSLSVGPTELLQQPLNLLTHENSDDGDLHVARAGAGAWSVTWSPSTPIGDYHRGELFLGLAGLPDWVVTYDPDARLESGGVGQRPAGRASIGHLLNSVREVRRFESGQSTSSTRFAVVSTFTPAGRPLDAAVELLRNIQSAGVSAIVVDTSPGWLLGSHPEIADLASVYVRRANVGWDFSSWITAHTHPELSEIVSGASELIWINDSCYGPFAPMSEILEQAAASRCDVWGLASSNQVKPHIQSFFLRFSEKALKAGLIDEFITGYPFPTVKSDIILEGEVRMTEVAKELGLSVGVGYSYEDVVVRYLSTWDARMARLRDDPIVHAFSEVGKLTECYRYMYHVYLRDALENGTRRNASHEMWDSMLEMGFPMVKRELVMSNPQNVPLLGLEDRLGKVSPTWDRIVRGERTLNG